MVDKAEWFGSPTDMCQAYAGLWAQQEPPVNTALSINDGGIALPSAEFPTVWFKGGSEPGVITLNYLVRRKDGRWMAIVGNWSRKDAGVDAGVFAQLMNRALILAASAP